MPEEAGEHPREIHRLEAGSDHRHGCADSHPSLAVRHLGVGMGVQYRDLDGVGYPGIPPEPGDQRDGRGP